MKRFDPSEIDNLGAVDRNLSQRLAGDAMLKAEHQQEDKKKAESAESQINKLIKLQSRDKKAYDMNCEMRKQFRVCSVFKYSK